MRAARSLRRSMKRRCSTARRRACAIGCRSYSHLVPALLCQPGARASGRGDPARALPGAFICVSSDVLPEIREYERTSTTVVNAYVGPVMVRSTSARCANSWRPRSARSAAHDAIERRHDGCETSHRRARDRGRERPCRGRHRRSAHRDTRRLLTPDYVRHGRHDGESLAVEGGAVVATDEYEVGGGISLSSRLAKGGGYALKLPVIDVSEVGAGGGSIVRVDAGGAPKVGPESAGAVPGPACYAKGGTEPTVTDATSCSAISIRTHSLAGRCRSDSVRAREAMQKLADRLGGDVLEVAHGVHRIANATMMRAVKAVSTYRGRDPREFILFAFGGNGGIHAAALAAELQMKSVIVPPAAGVFSAVGLLCADHEAVRSIAFLRPLDATSVAETASHLSCAREAGHRRPGTERQRERSVARGTALCRSRFRTASGFAT